MDLAHLKIFYMIAREGSLTKAAHLLNTSQSSLSRTLQTLEYYAKAQLFERHARGLKLTPQGEKVFQHAQKMVQEHEAFKHSFFDQSNEMEGELKVITTPGMASIWLADVLPEFLRLHPKIRLDIIGSLFDVEINIEDGDVLLRTYIDHHPNLIQEHILASHHKLWASQEYLKKWGTPQTAEELDNHRLLTFEKAKFNVLANNYWLLEIGANIETPREPYLTINSLEGLISYAKHGLGIIGLPQELVNLKNYNRELINVLPDIDGPIVNIYCIYSAKMQNSKKIKLFVDYLKTIKNT